MSIPIKRIIITTYADSSKSLRFRIRHPKNGQIVHSSHRSYPTLIELYHDVRRMKAGFASDEGLEYYGEDGKRWRKYWIELDEEGNLLHKTMVGRAHEAYANQEDCVHNYESVQSWFTEYEIDFLHEAS